MVSKIRVQETVYAAIRDTLVGEYRDGSLDNGLHDYYGTVEVRRADALNKRGPYCCQNGVNEYARHFFKDQKVVLVGELLATLDKPMFGYNSARRARGAQVYDTIFWAIAGHTAGLLLLGWEWREVPTFEKGAQAREEGEAVARVLLATRVLLAARRRT